jgi:hypothetical protein
VETADEGLALVAHATAIKLHIATHNTTKARHPSNTGCTYATPSSSRLPSKSSPHEGKPHVSGQTIHIARSIFSYGLLTGPNIHPHQTKFQ